MKTINIVGAGRLGKTLARLWSENGVFKINDVFCTTIESAEDAVAFIGDGRAVFSLKEISLADIYLIATPDQQIKALCKSISNTQVCTDRIFIHCSGSLSSDVLKCAKDFGAFICSVHPVHSFASPERSIKHFQKTLCGAEGDGKALDIISPAFNKIGGKIFHINSDTKILYHAAVSMACNYTVVLQNIAIEMFGAAGIKSDEAMKILEPIMSGTIDNVFDKGTVHSLTGPIARGDVDTVLRHMKKINEYDNSISEIYKLLGNKAIDISKEQGIAEPEHLLEIKKILEK